MYKRFLLIFENKALVITKCLDCFKFLYFKKVKSSPSHRKKKIIVSVMDSIVGLESLTV